LEKSALKFDAAIINSAWQDEKFFDGVGIRGNHVFRNARTIFSGIRHSLDHFSMNDRVNVVTTMTIVIITFHPPAE